MLILDILNKPDSEIIRIGLFIKEIVKEYRKITGIEPCFCDSQLKNYLRIVRNHYKKNDMVGKIYFDGIYYDANAIKSSEKDYICKKNPVLYENLARIYGWDIKKDVNIKRVYKKHSK